MPAIRDGRGKLHVHDMAPPPANPPSPVERSRVSEQRMADFAAERAAAAAKATPPKPTVLTPGSHWAAKRLAKAERIFTAIRETSNRREAAKQAGITEDAIAGLIGQYRRDGVMPADVDEILRKRQRAGQGGGAKVEAEGGEEGAPATAAVAAEQPDPEPAASASTPPSPPIVVEPGVAPEYSAPDPPAAPAEIPIVHLTITVDVVRLAEVMRSWAAYQITPFFDGLAKVIHEAQS